MNTENTSKRDVNYQICSTPIILATAVATLPWTLLHESWNLGRFPFPAYSVAQETCCLSAKSDSFSLRESSACHQLSSAFQE